MKTSIKYIVALLAIAFTFASCSKDEDTPIKESEELLKIKQIENTTHTIELYSKTGFLQQGFNSVRLKIKDNQTQEYVNNASITWKPLMHMEMMTHSCPFSTITQSAENNSIYTGYLVFQMAQNDTEYWDLEIKYTINGTQYSATSQIDVPAASKRNLTTFTGTDGIKYIVALLEPIQPRVALNDFRVGVWKMENMNSFPMVDDYTVKIDPRMPSMGNHSSPNNVAAVQSSVGSWYNGKLALTMTGYWKINLQVADKEGTILKGETISETTVASSIFFEIEF